MPAGAGDEYWEKRRLPSTFKHALLQCYLPKFSGMTGSRSGSVVYLDGYAGRGRYVDGSPASAELILKIAEFQGPRGIACRLFFYERDAVSYAALKPVVDEYRGRGIDAKAVRSEVIDGLDEVVASASGLPMFLFLDPCGLGVPFTVLTQALTGPRKARWPPTEVLLNFSLEAVRRIGGHVTAPRPNEKTMSRLDDALGGPWWREHMREGVSDEAVAAIVNGFMNRLSSATGMSLFAMPVRRAPGQKPIYYLVFGTRSSQGLWHVADCTARATDAWWAERAAQRQAMSEAGGQELLFSYQDYRPTLDAVEAEARPQIAENIARLVALHGTIRVGDYPAEVVGEYLGRVREKIVRTAIKDLHASGRTPSTGIGGKVADLKVSPPR
jgi:three-Cys-motif partner protein